MALLVETFIVKSAEVYVISRKVMEKLSDRDKPDGLMCIGIVPYYDKELLKLKDDAVILILDGLEKPGNIGTIIRTCDGAGADAVFVCNKRVRMTNPKLVKGSMGAMFAVPILEFEQVDACLSWLKERGFHIYLADPEAAETYKSYQYEGRTALVIGNERYGISKEWYGSGACTLAIPMRGICDSLNAGTAASVFVYEICMQRHMNRGNAL